MRFNLWTKNAWDFSEEPASAKFDNIYKENKNIVEWNKELFLPKQYNYGQVLFDLSQLGRILQLTGKGDKLVKYVFIKIW